MSFNKNTYDLASRDKYNRTWDEAYKWLAKNFRRKEGLLMPCSDEKEALATMFELNKWRAAYRAQHGKEAGTKFDHIVLRVENKGKDFFIRIRDRSNDIKDLYLYDAEALDADPAIIIED